MTDPMTPDELAAIEARDATAVPRFGPKDRAFWGDMDRRALLAEVRRLTDQLAESNSALKLAMRALTNHLDAYAKVSELLEEHIDDDEVVYETIGSRIAKAERALAEIGGLVDD